MYIQIEPGLTNSHHEPRTMGWLGTTSGIAEVACGEYETMEEARAACEKLGYTEHLEDNDDYAYVLLGFEFMDAGIVEAYTTRDAIKTPCDVADFMCDAHNEITPETTDDEIQQMADDAKEYADAVEVYVYGDIVEYLTEIRDEKVEGVEKIVDWSERLGCATCNKRNPACIELFINLANNKNQETSPVKQHVWECQYNEAMKKHSAEKAANTERGEQNE